ncbi:hypothetical protein EUTSA_v10002323mg [Eutrema salsugineum]|uniref:DUF659 domain-containing protein n=1 Tax=Eutrema salsugineum TaxID=72664 RepID=V4M213_EUTSA|nr:hypothetical protein EUTSA_v10002323mg [Eutrema salsugineum]
MDDPPPALKRNSHDVGWEYEVLNDPKNPDKVKCLLCGKDFSGGVVSSCPVSTKADQEKCMKALDESKEKKNLKRKHEEALRAEVNIEKGNNVDELEEELGTLNTPHFQGPMDRFARNINPEASLATQKRQQSIHDAISKEKTHVVRQYCSRWVYHAAIPFNAIANDAFRLFCEALGCSVMTDSWTDMKRRSIMNLCVNSRGGTCFLSSKDTSKDSHTGEYIFKYIDGCIKELGAKRIVQVVTDNATNNVAAAKMLKEKRPTIFWSGCVAHTIDLMLEGVSKLQNFDKALKGKNVFETVMSFGFWNSVMMVLKIFSPLVKVLRLADGENTPPMDFIYGEILEGKKCIKEACDHVESIYQPVFKIIDEKMKGNWWSTYGCGAPTLQKLATRILALTSSSSGCERNWSCFESQKKIREQIADAIFEDGNEDTVEEWIVGPRLKDKDSDINLVLATQLPRLRDIYDDEFEFEP